MAKWILGIILGLIALFVAVSYALPRELTVEQTVTMPVSPEVLRPFLTDFHRWPEWTQFNSKNDATVKWTYSGPPSGAGSVAEWAGKEMGSGRLEMLSDDLKQGVRFRVTFKSHAPSTGRIVVEPTASGSTVTWTMTEEVPPLLRIPARWTRPSISAELREELTKLSEVVSAPH